MNTIVLKPWEVNPPPLTQTINSNSAETNRPTDLYHISPLAFTFRLQNFIFTSTLRFQPIRYHFLLFHPSYCSTLVDHLASFFADAHPVSRASSTYTCYLPESNVIIGVINQ